MDGEDNKDAAPVATDAAPPVDPAPAEGEAQVANDVPETDMEGAPAEEAPAALQESPI